MALDTLNSIPNGNAPIAPLEGGATFEEAKSPEIIGGVESVRRLVAEGLESESSPEKNWNPVSREQVHKWFLDAVRLMPWLSDNDNVTEQIEQIWFRDEKGSATKFPVEFPNEAVTSQELNTFSFSLFFTLISLTDQLKGKDRQYAISRSKNILQEFAKKIANHNSFFYKNISSIIQKGKICFASMQRRSDPHSEPFPQAVLFEIIPSIAQKYYCIEMIGNFLLNRKIILSQKFPNRDNDKKNHDEYQEFLDEVEEFFSEKDNDLEVAKTIERDRVIAALLSANARADKANNMPIDPHYAQIIALGIQRVCPAIVRTLEDLGPTIYFLIGRVESLRYVAKNKNVKAVSDPLFANARKNCREEFLGELRSICVDLRCSDTFDVIFKDLVWQRLPQSFDTGQTVNREEFIDDLFALLHNNSFKERPGVNHFVNNLEKEVTFFAKNFCHPNIARGQIMSIMAYVAEKMSSMKEILVGMPSHEANKFRLDLEEVIQKYLKSFPFLNPEDNSEPGIVDSGVSSLQLLPESNQEGDIHAPSISREDIAQLFRTHVFLTIDNPNKIKIIKSLEQLIAKLPDTITAQNYQEALLGLSKSCIFFLPRIYRANFDTEIATILNDGEPMSEAYISDEVMESMINSEKAIQNIFRELQVKLQISLVDCKELQVQLSDCFNKLNDKFFGSHRIEVSPSIIDIVKKLREFAVDLDNALPKRIDILQTIILCDNFKRVANVSRRIALYSDPKRKKKYEQLFHELDESFSRIVKQHFSKSNSTKSEYIVPVLIKIPSLEGQGPISRDAFLTVLQSQTSQLVAQKMVVPHWDKILQDCVEKLCPVTIESLADVREFFHWFGGQAATIGILSNSNLPGILLSNGSSQLANAYLPVTLQIGRRFGIENFHLSARSIQSLTIRTNHVVALDVIKNMVLSPLKMRNFRKILEAALDNVRKVGREDCRTMLLEHFRKLQSSIPNLVEEWYPDGIASTEEVASLESLVISSIGVSTDFFEQFGSNEDTGMIFMHNIIVEFYEPIFAKLRKELNPPIAAGGYDELPVDESIWGIDKTFMADIPLHFEDELQNAGGIGIDAIQIIINEIFELKKDRAFPANIGYSAEEKPFPILVPQLSRFRRIARAVVADVTKEGSIVTASGYQRLKAGFGFSVSNITGSHASELQAYLITNVLRPWFIDIEARFSSQDTVMTTSPDVLDESSGVLEESVGSVMHNASAPSASTADGEHSDTGMKQKTEVPADDVPRMSVPMDPLQEAMEAAGLPVSGVASYMERLLTSAFETAATNVFSGQITTLNQQHIEAIHAEVLVFSTTCTGILTEEITSVLFPGSTPTSEQLRTIATNTVTRMSEHSSQAGDFLTPEQRQTIVEKAFFAFTQSTVDSADLLIEEHILPDFDAHKADQIMVDGVSRIPSFSRLGSAAQRFKEERERGVERRAEQVRQASLLELPDTVHSIAAEQHAIAETLRILISQAEAGDAGAMEILVDGAGHLKLLRQLFAVRTKSSQ